MNSPTLLVGLGGTGSKIVAKVSEMISEEQRRNISCVIFDTDANDIPMIKDHHQEIRVVQTSARMTVGEYLEADHHARDSWFPVNPPLNRKVLSEGAGQVRSISRLGFESAVRAGGMKPLEDAISDLFKVDSNKRADQALRVTIVSSLAGGTGSGLIVPVAMYIRQYIESNYQGGSNITRGFFILPEVFYGAIPAAQRDNLKSNAYASLRELDAFLMKGNQTLSDEYSESVKMELPVPGTNKYKEYDVSPYDFCFLFDAQNAGGEKLNSLEQYMDHAANILYSMSIGPVNKRSNSSEDNVIRKLAEEKGRNRYAGAGASRLVYPYDDICQLIGLSWASKGISEQWLKYDQQYEAEKRIVDKKREEGHYAEEADRSKIYRSTIESEKDDFPFAKSIYTAVKGNGKTEQDTVKKYMNALLEKINSASGGKDDMLRKRAEASDQLEAFDPNESFDENKNAVLGAIERLDEYQKTIEDYIRLEADTLAYSLFKGARAESGSEGEGYLFNAIKRGDEVIHPNAVRYFFILVKKEMEDQLAGLNNKLETRKREFDEYKINPTGIEDFNGYEPTGFRKNKKGNAKMEEARDNLRSRLTDLDAWQQELIQRAVLKAGVEYVGDLVDGYESFYQALSDQLKSIDKKEEEIIRKYQQAPGMTVRFVAASRDNLNKLIERYPYSGSMIYADPGLSERISDRVFDYAEKAKEDKPNPSRYFSAIFEESILPHYQQEVDKKAAGQLDKGILKAIELEADLNLDRDSRDSQMAVDRYVRNVIETTRNLATPFIEKPQDLFATSIDACAFNPEYVPRRGDEGYEAKLIQEELIARGGEGDEDIDRNTILFYQSYYGLRANSLSKFAPPIDTETYKKSGGDYYMAYRNLVSGIHPNSKLSQQITPHIDKRWHLAAKMPDLDEESQNTEEYRIHAAFYWGLVYKLFDFKVESSGQEVYKLNNARLDLENGDLLYDGLHRSGKIYEVLQSLSMQPEYVSAIINYAANIQKGELDNLLKPSAQETYDSIGKLSIDLPASQMKLMVPKFKDEVEVKSGATIVPTLFDIPWILKLSVPSGTISNQKLLNLLEHELKETINYLSSFCSPDELSGAIRPLISKQLLGYQQHLNELDERLNLKNDELTTDGLERTAKILEKNGVYDLAKEVREYTRTLKNERSSSRSIFQAG